MAPGETRGQRRSGFRPSREPGPDPAPGPGIDADVGHASRGICDGQLNPFPGLTPAVPLAFELLVLTAAT